jgi:metal-responsive CopG/Arc/MetJ family transcriptional regulator
MKSKTIISFTLSPNLIERLDAVSEAAKRSRSNYVEIVLEKALNDGEGKNGQGDKPRPNRRTSASPQAVVTRDGRDSRT